MIEMYFSTRIIINNKPTNYYITSTGKLFHIKNGIIKYVKVKETKIYDSNHNRKQGYLYYSINSQGKSYGKFIHRLVAEAFIPNPYNKPEINHIDGNKHNNAINNLEWVTSKENKLHAKEHGLIHNKYGEDCPNSKYSNDIIYKVCELLENDELTLKQISSRTLVDIDTIYSIRAGRSYREISKKFIFPKNVTSSNTSYTIDDIKLVCELRAKKYPISEISKISGVKKSTVRDIIYKRRHKHISEKYNL